MYKTWIVILLQITRIYRNNILNFQEYTTIVNARTKNVWKLIVYTSLLVTWNLIYVYKQMTIIEWKYRLETI